MNLKKSEIINMILTALSAVLGIGAFVATTDFGKEKIDGKVDKKE